MSSRPVRLPTFVSEQTAKLRRSSSQLAVHSRSVWDSSEMEGTWHTGSARLAAGSQRHVSALGQPLTSLALAAVVAATATLQQPYDRVEPAPDDGDEEGDGRRLRPTTRMALVVSLTAR